VADRPQVGRGGGASAVIAVVIVVPVLYVLSIGPAAGLARRFGVAKGPLTTLYAPVIWLHDHTPLKRPLEWYVDLWGGK